MPDRIIRDEMLESDRWLDLPSDTDRLSYIVLRLVSDDFGNLEAGPRRIFRILAKCTQVKTEESGAIILTHLSDADMLRMYKAQGRDFIHLPRGRPTGSYLVRKCPPSPWCDPEIKLGKHVRSIRNQGLAKNVTATSLERNRDVLQGVGVGEGIGVGIGATLGAPPVDNFPARWWATPDSMAAKAKSLGVNTTPGESKDALYKRIKAKLDSDKAKSK